MPRLADEAAFAPSDYISPEYAPHAAPRPTGPVLLSSSSLLNWNGARMVSAPLQATQFLSSTSVSVSPLPSLEMASTHALVRVHHRRKSRAPFRVADVRIRRARTTPPKATYGCLNCSTPASTTRASSRRPLACGRICLARTLRRSPLAAPLQAPITCTALAEARLRHRSWRRRTTGCSRGTPPFRATFFCIARRGQRRRTCSQWTLTNSSIPIIDSSPPCHDTPPPVALFPVRMFFAESPCPFSRACLLTFPVPLSFPILVFSSSLPCIWLFCISASGLSVIVSLLAPPLSLGSVVSKRIFCCRIIFGKLFAPSLVEPYVIPMYRTDFPMPSFLSLFNCVLVSLCISLRSTHFVK